MAFSSLRTWSASTKQRNTSRSRATTAEVTNSEVVYAENKLRLRRYEPRTEQQHATPILLVYAVINRPTVFDFEPDRSVVRQFLDHGFDVYVLDWGEPSRLDRTLGLGDFVARYLANCVEHICAQTGVDAVHIFGYCSGATLGAIYAALYPERVRTLGLLAPVLNFDAEGGIFDFGDVEAYYHPEKVVETNGNAPGSLLAFEFTLVDPLEYYLLRYLRLAANVDDDEYVDRFLRRVHWGADSVDVAGELYKQFLVDLVRENKLVEGRLTVAGRTVDLSNLEMPVLTVVGTADQFVPAAASLPFVSAIPSSDTALIEFPTDHIGLSTGERAHEELWPQLCAWFAERSESID
ncbi:alpha/beta fold hydrolase [Haloarchaeobius sp. DFWS5]|uniref:alpha/beta fold hydrolase n=1 Tax=Haloarchaeobius sp. DFWS5 TaxID=3446114 RepID=UPI003EBD75BC